MYHSLHDVVSVFGILLAVGCLLIAHDWRHMGPTVALHDSAAAAAGALLFAIPLVLTVFPLPYWASVVLFISINLGLAHVVRCDPGTPRRLLCFLFCCCSTSLLDDFVYSKFGAVVNFWTDSFCMTIVFTMVHWSVKEVMTLQRIDNWPGVLELEQGSDEHRLRSDFFTNACKRCALHCDFDMKILGIYRADSVHDVELDDIEDESAEPAFRKLFYGTSWHAAKGIICDGFRLSSTHCNFGRKIYFAPCPLNTLAHTNDFMESMRFCSRSRFILMCKVHLGQQSQMCHSGTHLTGYNFNEWRTCFRRQEGAVIGLDNSETGIPDHSMYSSCQARVDCIFEVLKHDLPLE